jgi:hypothetical protein
MDNAAERVRNVVLARHMFDFQAWVVNQKVQDTYLPTIEFFFLQEIRQRVVVHINREFSPFKMASPHFEGVEDGCQFLFSGCVFQGCGVEADAILPDLDLY